MQTTYKNTLADEEFGSVLQFKVPRHCRRNCKSSYIGNDENMRTATLKPNNDDMSEMMFSVLP